MRFERRLREGEAEDFSLEGQSERVGGGESSVPTSPSGGNQSGLRSGVSDPSGGGFFAQKEGYG